MLPAETEKRKDSNIKPFSVSCRKRFFYPSPREVNILKDISKKEAYVQEFKDKLGKSQVVVVAACEGLKVSEVTSLRKSVREAKAEMRVVKNTLLRRALHETPMAELEKEMVGNVAVTFGYEDPIAPVKVLFDFADKAKKFQFKAGFMEGKLLNVDELTALSKIPGKKELYSMLASAVQGPIRKFACAIDALRKKREEEAPAA
jgi:large subunit ribosomal protein L10